VLVHAFAFVPEEAEAKAFVHAKAPPMGPQFLQKLGQRGQAPQGGGNTGGQHKGRGYGGGGLEEFSIGALPGGQGGEEGPGLGLNKPAVFGQLQQGIEDRGGQRAIESVLRAPKGGHALLQLCLQAQAGSRRKPQAFECRAGGLAYTYVPGKPQKVQATGVQELASGHFHMAVGQKGRNTQGFGLCLQLV